MHRILEKLRGGDLRSIGRAAEVAAEVLAQPALLPILFDGIMDEDPRIRMRAADALEKTSASRPDLLQPFKQRILEEMSASAQKEVRWHVAQLVSRLELSAAEAERAERFLTEYLKDSSKIVCTFSMQALCDLAMAHPPLRVRALSRIEACVHGGSPAVRSRGTKLLAKLRER